MASYKLKIVLMVNLLIVLTIQSVKSRPQDAQGFLGELMKNYVTKNTRYYTIVNGVPVQESEDGPGDNSEILSRISSILPPTIANSPVLGQILQHDANTFPNSWTPMMSHVPPQPSDEPYAPLPYQQQQLQPSSIGRRYGEEYYRVSQPESKIITVEDLLPQPGQSQGPTEFKIQSRMSF